MVPNAFAQAFQNLDFEAATFVYTGISNTVGGVVSLDSALPGWWAYGGDRWVHDALYNGYGIFGAVGIYDGRFWPGPVSGRYSADLQAAAGSDALLFQIGQIPSDAKSIRFATTPSSLTANLNTKRKYWQILFQVNNQNIPCVTLDAQPRFVEWGADVSSFAGKTVGMGFDLHVQVPAGVPLWDSFVMLGLDNISFSPEPIPEPPASLLLPAGVVWLWVKRRSHQPRV